jgi:hypothetical protein
MEISEHIEHLAEQGELLARAAGPAPVLAPSVGQPGSI